jgi:hypothetical protein
MENERFQLQNVAIPLKWQRLAPKCCKLQGKRTEQQIQKKNPKRKNIIPQTIPDPFSSRPHNKNSHQIPPNIDPRETYGWGMFHAMLPEAIT